MAKSNVTTDHETIRQWVEARGGYPAKVKTTGKSNDVGVIRIDFPGYSGETTLVRISADEFFKKFDEAKLAFIYQDAPNSRFNKLVKRDTVAQKSRKSTKRKTQRSRTTTSPRKGTSATAQKGRATRKKATTAGTTRKRRARG